MAILRVLLGSKGRFVGVLGLPPQKEILLISSIIFSLSLGWAEAWALASTTTIPLTHPTTLERITPSVLGVNPTTNKVYVGGFTSPTNQAVLAVIDGATNTLTNTIALTDPTTLERIT